MAEEGNVTSSLKLDGLANGADTAPAVGIILQYVKDLSVENPNAPACFSWNDAPQIDVQFNIASTPVQADMFELELKITLTAKAEGGTAYIIDLAYGALIGIRNLDEASAHAFLYAEGPRILFPFARRIIADAVRDAGFTPLLLEPIDFNSIYLQQLAAQAEAQEATANPAGEA